MGIKKRSADCTGRVQSPPRWRLTDKPELRHQHTPTSLATVTADPALDAAVEEFLDHLATLLAREYVILMERAALKSSAEPSGDDQEPS
jgi:hypothetical protein